MGKFEKDEEMGMIYNPGASAWEQKRYGEYFDGERKTWTKQTLRYITQIRPLSTKRDTSTLSKKNNREIKGGKNEASEYIQRTYERFK